MLRCGPFVLIIISTKYMTPCGDALTLSVSSIAMGDGSVGSPVFSPLVCGVECKMLVTTKVRILKSMLLLVLHSCMKQLFARLLQWIPDTTHTIIITITTTTIYHHHHSHCYYRFHHTHVHVCTVYLFIHLVFLYIQQNI